MFQDTQEQVIGLVENNKNNWSRYGLTQSPFSSLSRFSMYYQTRDWANHLSLFNQFIRSSDQNLFMVMGEAGLGKTSFLNQLLTSAKLSTQVLQIQGSVSFSLRRFCDSVCRGFSLEGPQKLTGTQECLEAIMQLFVRGNQSHVLVIDDADELPISTLAAVLHLLLANHSGSSRSKIKIVLSGKAGLQNKIQLLWDMGEPTVSYENINLQRLTLTQIGDYLIHRLRESGLKERFCLSPDAIKEVYLRSSGVPLLINEAANRLEAKDLLVSNLWQCSGKRIKSTQLKSKRFFSKFKKVIYSSSAVVLLGLGFMAVRVIWH